MGEGGEGGTEGEKDRSQDREKVNCKRNHEEMREQREKWQQKIISISLSIYCIYANIVHSKSLTAEHQMSLALLKGPFLICVCALKVTLVTVIQHELLHTCVELTFQVSTEKLSSFSRYMWKQPSRVKLCTHVVLLSEAQTSNKVAKAKHNS